MHGIICSLIQQKILLATSIWSQVQVQVCRVVVLFACDVETSLTFRNECKQLQWHGAAT